jgi:hypothetical protein
MRALIRVPGGAAAGYDPARLGLQTNMASESMNPQSPQPDTGLQCPRCGYNLTAITSPLCPECGERFVITNARGYLAKHPPSALRRASVALWWVGTLLIVLSWLSVLPPLVGWIGFAIGGIGWLVSANVRR